MNDQINIIAKWLGTGSVDIFGCPFSGKDTQGRILADLFNGELIAGGDILRSHKDPQKIEQVLDSGGIIPSDYYLELVLPFLSQSKYRQKPLFLSAVGRAHGEESIIMKTASNSGHPIKAVILLDLTEAEVWRRFENDKRQDDRGDRADDRREVLQTRLKKFQDRTIPVIDFYRQKGLLVEVNGALDRETVTSEILRGLVKQALN
jgi:adenylate kinase